MRSRGWLWLAIGVALHLPACGPGKQSSGADETSGSESGSGGETGAETPCGTETCGPDEWCDWAQNGCGESDAEVGTCVPRPGPCPEIASPRVCACDGMMYPSACEAQNAGRDVSVAGGCPLIDDSFECGYTWCSEGFEYCRQDVSDTNEPDGWTCFPLPDACNMVPDCGGCLADETCADFYCDDASVPQVICPGG